MQFSIFHGHFQTISVDNRQRIVFNPVAADIHNVVITESKDITAICKEGNGRGSIITRYRAAGNRERQNVGRKGMLSQQRESTIKEFGMPAA